MRRGPETYFDNVLQSLKCSTQEAYRLTVDRYAEPLFAGYAFLEKDGGKYIALDDNGQETGVAVTGPSDEDVRPVVAINI